MTAIKLFDPWHMSSLQLTIPFFISILALTISFFSLVVSFRSYRRKTGIFIRGSFSIASNVECNDRYVHRLILENLKDRSVTIFSIYLRISHSYYIELEDCEDTPIILKPFETYSKAFGPLELYSVNCRQIDLNKLLDDSALKKRLILSTSEGRHKVLPRVGHWNPVVDYFKNHFTAIIKPVRSRWKENDVGSNIEYIVEFIDKDGKIDTLFLQQHDYQLKLFRTFSLTKESLESKEALESYLQYQSDNGRLSGSRFAVFDVQTMRKNRLEPYDRRNAIEGKQINFFRYYVLGRIATRYSNWALDRKNRRTTQASKARK